MSLHDPAPVGERIVVEPSAAGTAPTWAYQNPRGVVVSAPHRDPDGVHTIRLDGETDIRQISGGHLTRETTWANRQRTRPAAAPTPKRHGDLHLPPAVGVELTIDDLLGDG